MKGNVLLVGTRYVSSQYTHAHTDSYYKYIYSTSIYNAITNDSPITNCRSFPIFDFRVSPRKLRALLNTQTNLMEATITLDHGKHLTKPKKKNEQKNQAESNGTYVNTYIYLYMYLAMSPIGFRSNMRLNKKFLLICCLL